MMPTERVGSDAALERQSTALPEAREEFLRAGIPAAEPSGQLLLQPGTKEPKKCELGLRAAKKIL